MGTTVTYEPGTPAWDAWQAEALRVGLEAWPEHRDTMAGRFRESIAKAAARLATAEPTVREAAIPSLLTLGAPVHDLVVRAVEDVLSAIDAALAARAPKPPLDVLNQATARRLRRTLVSGT